MCTTCPLANLYVEVRLFPLQQNAVKVRHCHDGDVCKCCEFIHTANIPIKKTLKVKGVLNLIQERCKTKSNKNVTKSGTYS